MNPTDGDSEFSGDDPAIWAGPSTSSKERMRAGGLPRGVMILLGVLVASSAAAATVTDRPPSFADLTAPKARATGSAVSQTASAATSDSIVPTAAAATASAGPSTPAPVASIADLELKVTKLRLVGPPSEMADTLLTLAERLIVDGTPKKAEPALKEALALFPNKVEDASQFARALYDQGWGMLLSDQGAKAAEPLTRARAIRERSGGHIAELGSTLTLLAWAERVAGNNPGSVSVAKDLVVLARKNPDEVNLATALNGFGVTLVVAGDPVGALKHLREAVKLREAVGGTDLATSLHALGWALLGTRKKAAAAVPLARAAALFRTALPGSLDLANSLLLLGWAEREGKDFTSAIKVQQELVDLARRDVKGVELAASLEGLGLTQGMNDNATSAVTSLEEAVKLRKGPPSNELASSLHLLGWAYLRADKLADARTTLEKAIAMRNGLGLTKLADQSKTLLKMVTK